MARVGDDDHHDPLEAELPLGGVRERDVAVVRRVERAAEQADHSHTSVSSPISTSVPVRAPAALSAASSSSARRRRAGDAEAAVGAEDAVGLRARLRLVDEEVGEPFGVGRDGRLGRAELEQPPLEVLDPGAGRRRDA